jgi:glycosyltransferase involved in cell wall biosynthesis
VQWLGWRGREEKFIELMNSDLFVLTSHNENFANVVVESLHMGTAVLISEDVALSGFVKQNNMGWITSLNPEQIKAKLEEAYNDSSKRSQIRSEGRDVISRSFSEKILINSYLQEYNKVLVV